MGKIGRYQLKAEIGRGGMGTVYRALDPNFNRVVAIKVLPREMIHDPRFLSRFRKELAVISSLEHSAIVPVYDGGEESGQPYWRWFHSPNWPHAPFSGWPFFIPLRLKNNLSPQKWQWPEVREKMSLRVVIVI